MSALLEFPGWIALLAALTLVLAMFCALVVVMIDWIGVRVGRRR